MDETLLHVTRDLQRFGKPVAPVFIFGSFLGVLALTETRLLFLSSGGAGHANALADVALGVLSPEQLRSLDRTLENVGSLAIPYGRVVAVAGYQRWDFGRYLRIDYVEEDGTPKQTSVIPRGVAGSEWIEGFISAMSRLTGLAQKLVCCVGILEREPEPLGSLTYLLPRGSSRASIRSARALTFCFSSSVSAKRPQIRMMAMMPANSTMLGYLP